MQKIARPQDLQAELRRLLAYCQGHQPSREKLASELRELANRVKGAAYSPYPSLEDMKRFERQKAELMMESAKKAHPGHTLYKGRTDRQIATALAGKGLVKVVYPDPHSVEVTITRKGLKEAK